MYQVWAIVRSKSFHLEQHLYSCSGTNAGVYYKVLGCWLSTSRGLPSPSLRCPKNQHLFLEQSAVSWYYVYLLQTLHSQSTPVSGAISRYYWEFANYTLAITPLTMCLSFSPPSIRVGTWPDSATKLVIWLRKKPGQIDPKNWLGVDYSP